jgi:UDP-N-acetylmuramoyl-L-alanyl-D-glutamate--2,6-diaminopimelate ligase
VTGSLPGVPIPPPGTAPGQAQTGPVRPATVTPRRLDEVARQVGGELAGPADVQVTGLTLDSRTVRPGDLYVALPGASTHGARFAGQVRAAGAAAVLTDPAGQQVLAGTPGEGLPVVVVDRPRARLGELSAWVYGDPATRLLMLGITGTNGKTTTSYLLDAALRAAGRTTGMVGTVELRVADQAWPSRRTTPEAPDLHALLALMVERGATACSMEVSSHALAQHRVDGVVFDLVGFTNLSQDHLDFHRTMEAYFAAKADLFTPARARRGVVCVDDDWGRRLADLAGIPVSTLSTPQQAPGGTGRPADWQVHDVRPDPTGDRFVLTGPAGLRLDARSPLPGGFNVANTALALAMLVETGLDPGLAVQALGAAGPVPGRMELVAAGTPRAGAPVGVVDYAHTPDAVAAALAALRPGTPGPLVVVLGAGGDRDRDKRPMMGAAAAAVADVVVVTDDNPRSEPPAGIRAAVLDGARGEAGRAGRPVTVLEVPDRRAAVAEAVRRAWALPGGPAGTVLLAGKGHEQGQEAAGVVTPFDDRAVLRAALDDTAPARPGDREPAR